MTKYVLRGRLDLSLQRRMKMISKMMSKSNMLVGISQAMKNQYEEMNQKHEDSGNRAYFDDVTCVPYNDEGYVEIIFTGDKERLIEWRKTIRKDDKKLSFADKRMGIKLTFGNVEKK